MWLWEAFTSLSRKRVITESGPQPIPVSEIRAYAEYFTIPLGLRGELFYIVGVLDEVFLEHATKLRAKEAEKMKRTAKKNIPTRRR